MQQNPYSNRSAASLAYEQDMPNRGMGFKNTQELKTSVEGWEKCLRNQIMSHPRIALGMGLMAGLLAGWWVKR